VCHFREVEIQSKVLTLKLMSVFLTLYTVNVRLVVVIAVTICLLLPSYKLAPAFDKICESL